MASNGHAHFEKIRLRLDIARIEDPELRNTAIGAQYDIADTIGALSHVALSNEEIAKKIGWAGRERLLLAPEANCAFGVGAGMMTPQGRPIMRRSYSFSSATDWKADKHHSLSFSAHYQDAIVQQNMVTHRYFFEKFAGRWMLVAQELVSEDINSIKCPRSSHLPG